MQETLLVVALHQLSGNRPPIWMRFVALVVVGEIWPRTGATKVTRGELTTTLIFAPIFRRNMLRVKRNELPIPSRFVRLTVEKNCVRYVPVPDRCIAVCTGPLPYDFVLVSVSAKHRIQHQLKVVARGRVAVEVEAAAVPQHAVEFDQPHRHHRQIGHQRILADRRMHRVHHHRQRAVGAAGYVHQRVPAPPRVWLANPPPALAAGRFAAAAPARAAGLGLSPSGSPARPATAAGPIAVDTVAFVVAAASAGASPVVRATPAATRAKSKPRRTATPPIRRQSLSHRATPRPSIRRDAAPPPPPPLQAKAVVVMANAKATMVKQLLTFMVYCSSFSVQCSALCW